MLLMNFERFKSRLKQTLEFLILNSRDELGFKSFVHKLMIAQFIFSITFVESLPVKMVRAKLRESLSLTLPPYETNWAWTSLVYHLDGKTTWTIERYQVMEDFLELTRRRLKFLTEQTA